MTSRQCAISASHRPARIARAARPGSSARKACIATSAGNRIARERNGSRLSLGTDQPSRTLGSAARSNARLSSYWVEISARSSNPVLAQCIEHAQLVARAA